MGRLDNIACQPFINSTFHLFTSATSPPSFVAEATGVTIGYAILLRLLVCLNEIFHKLAAGGLKLLAPDNYRW